MNFNQGESCRAVPLVVTATALICFAFAPYAAGEPLSKSGSASVHSGWSAAGQLKDLGEKRAVWTGVYSGTSFSDGGKGFLHKMAWICPGATMINGASYVHHGYCFLTDSDGDKIYGTSEAKGPAEGVDLGRVNTNDHVSTTILGWRSRESSTSKSRTVCPASEATSA